MPRIELMVTHTHAGVIYRPGEVLEVDELTARWLIERRVGRIAEMKETQAKIAVKSAVASKRKTNQPNTAQE